MLREEERVPMARELGMLGDRIRRIAAGWITVREGTLAVEAATGWMYFPGEKYHENTTVYVFERGKAAGEIEVFGEFCENGGYCWRTYYHVSRSFCLADYFFDGSLDPEDRFLDIQEIRGMATDELLSSFRISWFDESDETLSLLMPYKWLGKPVKKKILGSVLERYTRES